MEKYQSHFVQRINSPYLMAIAKKLGCKGYKNEINQFETDVDSDDSISIRAANPTPVFYYHPDHLGTSTVISNSTGGLHQYFFNLPFGETVILKLLVNKHYVNSGVKSVTTYVDSLGCSDRACCVYIMDDTSQWAISSETVIRHEWKLTTIRISTMTKKTLIFA